jgi:hypothetical protein
MNPLPSEIINRLRLEAMATAELSARGNLLPPTPGLELLVDHVQDLARWMIAQLRNGWKATPQLVTSARKAGHGIRPVPLVAIEDRILYRALVEFLLRNEPQLDRSPKAYVDFVQNPIVYAGEIGGGIISVVNSKIRYVVKTDITAFYQYIDHGILASELLAKSPDYDAVTALAELLGEIMGRAYGLPQLLDPSDRLSEIYIDMVERDLLRRGLAVWRYNDDFRIACRTYGDTLRAIESLDDAARQVGLVISEYKTTTPKFEHYAFDVLGLEVNDDIPPATVEEIEDALVEAEYLEPDDEQELEKALGVLTSARPGAPSGGIDLEAARGPEVGELRKAIRTLSRLKNPAGLERVADLVRYLPSLTPSISNYLLALADESRAEVATTFDDVRTKVALSDWQTQWVVYVSRIAALLEQFDSEPPEHSQNRITWVRKQWRGNSHPVLRAEAGLALASVGDVSVADIEYRLRSDPGVLRPWHLAAINLLRMRDPALVSDQYWRGAAEATPFARWLLKDVRG